MMALQTFVFLAVVAFAFPIGPTCRAAQAGASELPPEVLTFVHRRARCQEWSSSEVADPHRAAETKSALQTWKCAEAPQDERALREKFAGDSRVLAAIEADWRIIVRRVPVQIAPESEPSGSDR